MSHFETLRTWCARHNKQWEWGVHFWSDQELKRGLYRRKTGCVGLAAKSTLRGGREGAFTEAVPLPSAAISKSNIARKCAKNKVDSNFANRVPTIVRQYRNPWDVLGLKSWAWNSQESLRSQQGCIPEPQPRKPWGTFLCSARWSSKRSGSNRSGSV